MKSRLIVFLLLVMIFLTSAARPTVAQRTITPQPVDEWLTHAGSFQRHSYVPQELPLNSSGSLNLKWSRFLGERIEVEMQPLVTLEKVYIGLMNGKLYALDREDGETAWVHAGASITSTPSIADVNGRRMIFFGASDGVIFGLDAQTGEELWQHPTGGPILSTPAVASNTVLVGSLDGYFYALDARTGRQKWKFESSGPIANTPALEEEIKPGKAAVYFASGDNTAYALSLDGQLVWKQVMHGGYTKYTQAVVADGAVLFLTRKAGREYTQHMENIPDLLTSANDLSTEQILGAWADYYLEYPLRRTLYIFDAETGVDLWQPDRSKTAYVPLYIPYWGLISPVIDENGDAWFPASGGGGDGGLDHDLRLWKLDLSNGGYTQIAHQNNFLHRFDETGRATMAGARYYTTISEDVGYFDTNTLTRNSRVFGNGFSSHRAPQEFAAGSGVEIFGGMQKFFTRFAGSAPGGYAGAADSPSQLVVAGEEAFFTTWGHIYALTVQPTQPKRNFGELDLAGPPSITLTRDEATSLLNEQVKAILASGETIPPASRMWSWGHLSPGSFWHSGEMIRSLVDTLPYLERQTAIQLKDYLISDVINHLLEPRYYEYRYACLDFDSQSILDPCPVEGQRVSTGWYWTNQNLSAERLYALYRFAVVTDDWGLIVQHWDFIRSIYAGFSPFWDAEAGFFLFPEWQTAPFQPSLQMAAAHAVSEMALYVNDQETYRTASAHLKRMQAARVEWGQYVSALYDTGELKRVEIAGWEEIGYDPRIQIVPVEGYLDQHNDFRQVYRIYRDDAGELKVEYAAPRNQIYPYHLVGFHPILPENAPLLLEHLEPALSGYIGAVEMIAPFWYMGDYNHNAVIVGHEEDSLSPVLVNDIFLTKAYVFGCSFESLAPYLPWPFEDYQERDIFRLQNLTALLHAPDHVQGSPAHPLCPQPARQESKQESSPPGDPRNMPSCCEPYRCRSR